MYYAIDASGNVAGEISAPRGHGEVPVIYDESGGDATALMQVLDPTMMQFIARVFHASEIETLHPQFFRMSEPKSRNITVKMQEGWSAHMTADAPVEPQLKNLNLTLAHSVPANKRATLNYIDVRFGERVYVKYR